MNFIRTLPAVALAAALMLAGCDSRTPTPGGSGTAPAMPASAASR